MAIACSSRFTETKRLAVDFAALNKVVVAQPGFNLQEGASPPWHDHTMVILQGRFYLGDQSLVSGEKNVIHHLLLGLFISDRGRWVDQKLDNVPQIVALEDRDDGQDEGDGLRMETLHVNVRMLVINSGSLRAVGWPRVPLAEPCLAISSARDWKTRYPIGK